VSRKDRIEDLGRIAMLIEQIRCNDLLTPADCSSDDFVKIYYDVDALEDLYVSYCALVLKIELIDRIAKGETQ
jgi:hypothetical protein